MHTEILLPDIAPAEFADRAVLWNAVEKIEKAKTSQLAREIELALPVELTREQGISLVTEYVKQHFVAAGMCADIAVHDTGGGNPHAHVMLTMRPFLEGGKWGTKQKKEYILDPQGNKIYDPIKRQYECNSIPTTDWNEHTKAEEWRAAWADCVNLALEQQGIAERVDHRSYERQMASGNEIAADQIPTVHLGAAASQMEKRGIRTERGNLNREIEVSNQTLRQLKARIGKLKNWLKEEQASIAPTTLADYIQSILSRKAQAGKSSVSQSIYDLKDASKMLNSLTVNSIMDMAGLDEKFSAMIGEQLDIGDKLKLKKHLEQYDVYLKFKGKKALSEADKILFREVHSYLKDIMKGHSSLPVNAWRAECTKLTKQQKTLNQRYLDLKAEVHEAEQIRKRVYDILRREQQAQQPQKSQDIFI